MSRGDRVAHLYVNQKLSTTQIAERLDWNLYRVRKALAAAGVELRSRAEGIRLRADTIAEAGRRRRGERVSEEGRANMSAARHRWAEENAVGVSEKATGYVVYTRGEHKGRSVHVVRMEKRLGRPLREDEVVHHIDGCRSNNDINNLALMTRSAHGRLHAREESLAGNQRDRRNDGTFC